MAVIKQRSKVASIQDPIFDWDGFNASLTWPAGLSEKERLSLFRRGKKDARHGLVGINEYGAIASPFCETLVQAANQRIELEWMNCINRSFEAQVYLRQIETQIESLNQRLEEATIRKDEALDAIRKRHFDGDDVVSDHLSTRRQQRREKPILDRFDQESKAINDALNSAEYDTIPYRYLLSRAEESARSREQLVRADYLWKLSVYAYGASNYLKITPDMVNDSALTDEPREKFEKLFGVSKENATRDDLK